MIPHYQLRYIGSDGEPKLISSSISAERSDTDCVERDLEFVWDLIQPITILTIITE